MAAVSVKRSIGAPYTTFLFFRMSFEVPKWRNSESSELYLRLPLWLEGYGLFR